MRTLVALKILLHDKATTAGWLLPLHYFREHGIDDYKSWLSESYFAGTHEGAIHDVLERKADVGAAKNTVFSRLASSDPRVPGELMILRRSPDVHRGRMDFAIRGSLPGPSPPPSVRQKPCPRLKR